MPDFADHEADFLGVDPEERRKRRDIMDQRSGEALRQKWQQSDREELEQAEALTAPPVITEPRCDTCQSPHRIWIERQLVRGLSYSAIARSIPPDSEGKQIDRRSISHHYQEHMRVEQATMRAVLEEEADLLGQNVEEGVRGAFTMRGALDVLVRRAYDDALAGITTVEPRDMIQMIKLYNEMNVNSASSAVEEAKTAIRIFMAALQNVLVKGDLIERELGIQLLEEVSAEVARLREDEAIEVQMEKHLAIEA